MKIPSDRILVEPIKEEQNDGFIVQQTKNPPQKGTVVAVGIGKNNEPLMAVIGDTVLFAKHAGTQVDIDGKSLLFMRESDIFCYL